MKRFIISILTVSVFFLGLGALVENTSAKFKSDDKALALIAKARQAIGGDAAIAGVQGMRIVGRTTRTIETEGKSRIESGETEIAMMLPDKLMKTMKLGNGHDGGNAVESHTVLMGEKVRTEAGSPTNTKVFVTEDDNGSGAQKRIVIRKADGTEKVYTGAEADKIVAADAMSPDKGVKVIILKKPDGTTQELSGAEAEKVIVRRDEAAPRHNELLRLTLGLLLTPPQGIDVEYKYTGEADLDGTACNVINATSGGQTFKLFLDRSTNLPAGMTYEGMRMPKIFETKMAPGVAPEGIKNVIMIARTGAPMGDTTQITVKFSDFRSTGGVQLPYKWTQSVGAAVDETFEITNYELNPANLADSFKNQKVMVRVAKPDMK